MIVLLLFPLLLLSGCDFLGTDRWEKEADRLAAHRARWEANEPFRYQYRFLRECFLCPGERNGPVRIEVADGRLIEATYVEEIRSFFDLDSVIPAGTAVPDRFLESFGPVESLFEEIETAIDGRYERLEVEYEPAFGHPTRALLDSCLSCPDGGVLYTAADLVALP